MNDETKNEAKIVSIDGGRIREHLDGVMRGAVGETLNQLLDTETRLSVSDKSAPHPSLPGHGWL
jgi:hypothetical protein